ncbi:hypothetical protein JXM67_14720 [candidate division WOR-3 bacterium]|nr:hypothetical protein [candidate division WOR-3 bacterium]
MAIEVREAKTRKDKRLFIYLPERLYEKHYPRWVHPVYSSERATFDRRKNEAWGFCDVILFIALKEGVPVGRIAGIVNHKVNEHIGTLDARFGFFDTINDQEVAQALLRAVEDWARPKGCKRLIGPMGLTDLDPNGMLLEGFDEQTSIGIWWHPPYTHTLVENAGYEKEIDWFAYLIDAAAPYPAVYEKVARRLRSRTNYRLLEFSKPSQIKPYIIPIFELANTTHLHLYGFVPFSDKEIKKVASSYMQIIDPRFVKLAALDHELVGFVVAIPDMTRCIREARGRLFPLGVFKINNARKLSNRIDLLIGAIHVEHRGKGLDVLMTKAMYESARKAGIKYIDSHLILENNTRMRSEMKRVGGKIYKHYRAFRKAL